MRQHLNTLYVTTENAWLHKDGENAVVKVDGSERGRVPVHLLGGIVCFGSVGVTPALIGHCAGQGISVSLMSRTGRFLARVEGPVSGNVLLRRTQYRAADDQAKTAALVGQIVTGKVLNQRAVVRRALRDHGANLSAEACTRLNACERRLTDTARRSRRPLEAAVLRGIEGEAARAYYGVFSDFGAQQGSRLRLYRPIASSAARPRKRAVVVRLYAAGSRLPLGAGDGRS